MNSMLAFLDVGGWQVVLILALILVFFGARRIPDLAKSLGQGIREFKKATREVADEIDSAGNDASGSSQAQKKAPDTTQPAKPTAAPQSTEPKP